MTIPSQLRRPVATLPLTVAGVVVQAGSGAAATAPAIPSPTAVQLSGQQTPSGSTAPGGNQPSAPPKTSPPDDICDNRAYVTYRRSKDGGQVLTGPHGGDYVGPGKIITHSFRWA